MNEPKEIEFQIDTEMIKKILQGLKLQFVSDDVRVTLYPPQRGIFFTYEEVKQIENSPEKYVRSTIREILDRKFTK